MLVESQSFYGAVEKGSAAASLLTKSESDPAVDDCQLIYGLHEEPAAQLAAQWPSLLPAVRISLECGEQLLAAARERMAWTETTQFRHDGEHATFLYDETRKWGFAPKIVWRAFVRTQTATSGSCQRLRSSNQSRRPLPRAGDASVRTGSTSSVRSAVRRRHITSWISRLP